MPAKTHYSIPQLEKFFSFLRTRVLPARIREASLQALPFWIASFLVGLMAVGYAYLFKQVESWSVVIFNLNHYLIFLICPALFLASWFVVQRFSKPASGSGIPQLMAAISLAGPKTNRQVNYLMNFKVIVVKIVSSLLMVLGGGVIGREGPTIHIAGSVFRLVHRSLPASWPKISARIMLITGGAAGLAAAFNTPLGGLVFVMEELTRTHITLFRTAVFTAVIIAGLTAQSIMGPYLYLGYPFLSNPGISVLPLVILVSVLSGLGGAYMVELIFAVNKLKNKLFPGKKTWLFVTIAGLLLAVLIFFSGPEAMGSGKELMEAFLFHPAKHYSWILFPIRFVGPILSYTSGAAGGVFATSLSAGASLGILISQFFHMDTGTTNLVILSCMIAFLTGVTRTPFTASVLVLEMTDHHAAIFYFLLAGMSSYLAAFLVSKESFYEKVKQNFMLMPAV